MIITNIVGGLGNQMFQYALGRHLALKNKTELLLDDTSLNNPNLDTKRILGLGFFETKFRLATKTEIEKFKKPATSFVDHYLKVIFYKYLGFRKQNYLIEKSLLFEPDILKLTGDAYLQGFWHSEKYFCDIRQVLLEDFSLKAEFKLEEKEITKEIKNTNAVSLHIRRGDYARNLSINKVHGLCPLEYYAKAIELLAEKVSSPIFFVFSDDIAWVKENLKIAFPIHYVSDESLKDYEELMLMSFCKHNIIANSSFSWWGAWLNQNPEKIVVAPQQWFADASFDTADLVPASWHRL